jgi:hypothetical protein
MLSVGFNAVSNIVKGFEPAALRRRDNESLEGGGRRQPGSNNPRLISTRPDGWERVRARALSQKNKAGDSDKTSVQSASFLIEWLRFAVPGPALNRLSLHFSAKTGRKPPDQARQHFC